MDNIHTPSLSQVTTYCHSWNSSNKSDSVSSDESQSDIVIIFNMNLEKNSDSFLHNINITI